MSDHVTAIITQNIITSTVALGGAEVGYTPENVANKQNDLTPSAIKYPTVDAVNSGLAGYNKTSDYTQTILLMGA